MKIFLFLLLSISLYACEEYLKSALEDLNKAADNTKGDIVTAYSTRASVYMLRYQSCLLEKQNKLLETQNSLLEKQNSSLEKTNRTIHEISIPSTNTTSKTRFKSYR